MSIKTKVALGVAFLFLVIIIIGGLGLYYLEALSNDSQNILKDNYETLEYMKRIIEKCETLSNDKSASLQSIKQNVALQTENVTETGERELTQQLALSLQNLEEYTTPENISKLRQLALDIQEVNMQAIVRKNTSTRETYKRASTFLVITGTFFLLVTFTFILNFPGYIANPISQLTKSIKLIADKNYEERLYFNRNDEFKELADAFNKMAEKLDEYEHSSIAKILSEKRRIEAIINRMTDPVIGVDEHNRIVFVNDQALSLLHVSPQELIGSYGPDIAVQNDLFRSIIRQSSPGEGSSLLKIIVNGKENYFSKEVTNINYQPTGEKEPVNVGQVMILKNITTFKELDMAKTNFIATISHELKTPIASIQMCIKLLRDDRVGLLNEEQRSIIQTLNDETQRLSGITHELLDLAQVETGNIRLQLGKIDPLHVIQFAIEAVKFQAERKRIHLVQVLQPTTPAIRADEDKTVWVLINLLTNAIRYSPEEAEVKISCTSTPHVVRFEVQDSGPGIEAKHLDKLFEKFYQVPGTSTGTGLGLAIAKEFIEAQGGTIAVQSEPGKGSVFFFEIPTAV
jgi:signal transduction histidine kinase